MKLKAAYSNSPYKAKVSSFLMFSLALMVLVFSCPLKKLLTNEATHPSAIRTNQTNQAAKNNLNQDVALNSCSVKKPAQILKFIVSKEIKSFVPVPFTDALNSSAFANHYNLSAACSYLSAATSVSSSVPLFLRHLSLLI